jgi:hypothetical protein
MVSLYVRVRVNLFLTQNVFDVLELASVDFGHWANVPSDAVFSTVKKVPVGSGAASLLPHSRDRLEPFSPTPSH